MGGNVSVEKEFTGKVVWVVGASSGIGRALAIEFAKNGAKVIVSARRVEALNELCEYINKNYGTKGKGEGEENDGVAKALPFDATDESVIEQVMEQAKGMFGGKIDVMVMTQGVSNRGTIRATDISVDKKLFQINFFSYISLTKAILPHFEERKSGRFVVMSSVQGFFGLPGRGPYGSSKAALNNYFESLQAEVAHNNINVNICCPGYVRTELSLNALTTTADATHNKMDENTAKGYDPQVFARKTLQGIANNETYIVIAQTSAKFGIWLKRYFPSILRNIMKKRGRKLK